MMSDNARRAIEMIVGQPREVIGCDAKSIGYLEQLLGCPLPSCYREFLLAAGVSSGGFLEGSDASYASVWWNQSTAWALLLDDHGPMLPEKAFVFCSHQGYTFMFFKLGEGDDPPVYLFCEGESDFSRAYARLSDWMLDAAMSDLAQPTGP